MPKYFGMFQPVDFLWKKNGKLIGEFAFESLLKRLRSESLGRELPGWLRGGLVLGALVAILYLEKRRSLRSFREDKLRHDVRNLAMGTITAIVIRFGEKPSTTPLAKRVHKRRWGLLPRLNLPRLAEISVAVALHALHLARADPPCAVPVALHRVHHADLDLSTTTALRFHFVEMLLSAPFRVAQIVVIGAAPRSLSLWQTLTLIAILFHHSKVRLPAVVERWLCRVIMTPRLHGIHHSVVDDETNANWGTIFFVPDHLHRTVRLNIPQRTIDIGIPAFRKADELRIGDLPRMPFEEQRARFAPCGRAKAQASSAREVHSVTENAVTR